MRGLEALITESHALGDLPPGQLAVIAGCAGNVRFDAGDIVLHEGDAADRFFLLRHGRVALEIPAPGGAPLLICTLGPGELLGWSWLFPPYRWHFDARATEPVAAVAFDGACLRGKCDADHDLGYELMRRFAGGMLDRLQATRLQLLDVYGHVGAR
jgi:CRP/FNR family cyclic AMP-dependent transcriptional regulator